MDLYTRMIVGWAMSERITKAWVMNALRMAWFRRKPAAGLLHHSDQGSPYGSHDYQTQLKPYGILASMSRKGNCWDNSPMESFFSSLKNERTHHRHYASREEARQDTFEYIELFLQSKTPPLGAGVSESGSLLPKLPDPATAGHIRVWYP